MLILDPVEVAGTSVGAEPVGMPAKELGERIKVDAARFMKIAKEADIRLD